MQISHSSFEDAYDQGIHINCCMNDDAQYRTCGAREVSHNLCEGVDTGRHETGEPMSEASDSACLVNFLASQVSATLVHESRMSSYELVIHLMTASLLFSDSVVVWHD